MTVAGRPSLTAISKAVRYISRRVRSSSTLSEVKRQVSWELTAKCFTLAATPCPSTPRMNPAASLPARYGSSLKYSTFRPHRGLRFRFAPGPSTSPTPCSSAS